MTQLIDLVFKDHDEVQALFGTEDRHLHLIEDKLSVTIITRGEEVRVEGSEADAALVSAVLKALIDVINNKQQRLITMTGLIKIDSSLGMGDV